MNVRCPHVLLTGASVGGAIFSLTEKVKQKWTVRRSHKLLLNSESLSQCVRLSWWVNLLVDGENFRGQACEKFMQVYSSNVLNVGVTRLSNCSSFNLTGFIKLSIPSSSYSSVCIQRHHLLFWIYTFSMCGYTVGLRPAVT